MANKDILQITFNADTADFEKQLLSSMESIGEEVSDKLSEAFAKAGKNPKVKKQLTGVYQGLFDELSDAAGEVDKVNIAIDRFAGKIDYIYKVSRTKKIEGLFDNLSVGNVDKLLEKYDEVIEKEKEIERLSSNAFRDEQKNKTAIKSLQEIQEVYGDVSKSQQKYNEKLSTYIKNAGIEVSTVEKEIDAYSSLIALYEKVNTTKVTSGSVDAIRKQQALLYLMKEIQQIESGAVLFSNFRNKELIDVNGLRVPIATLTQQLEGAITTMANSLIKNIKKEMSEIFEAVGNEAVKMSNHQAKIAARTQAKVKNAMGAGDGSGGGSETGIGDGAGEYDYDEHNNIFAKYFDTAKKSAEELEDLFSEVESNLDRLYQLAENDELNSEQLKEYVALYKQLEDLTGKVDGFSIHSDYTDYFNTLVDSNKQLEKYADKLEKIREKGYLKSAAGTGSGDIDDSKIEELKKEITEVKEDITSLKGRVDNLEDTTAFDTLASQVEGFDEKIRTVDGSVENLVNSFKLLSELSLTDLQKVAIPFFNGINQLYQEKNGKQISGYWNTLKEEIEGSNVELRELLKLVGLYDSKSNSIKIIDSGLNNSGGIIGDKSTIIARKNDTLSGESQYNKSVTLKAKLDEAYRAGVNVARILDIIGTKESKVIFEIQETQLGNMLGNDNLKDVTKSFVNKEYLEATDEQILKLIRDIQALEKVGLSVDLNSNNLFYDKNQGFSFIDLSTDGKFFKSYEDMIEELGFAMQGTTRQIFEDLNNTIDEPLVQAFEERFNKLSEIAQQAYADAQDSHSPSKEFEKLENDAVDGIVKGANDNKERLKNVGKQMADNVKDGFKEGISEIDTTLPSGDQNPVLSENQTEVLSGSEAEIKHQADVVIEAEKEKQNAINDTSNTIVNTNNSINKSFVALTDEYGEGIEVYRGLRKMIGDGASSNRYHGGTFWTSDKSLSESYSDGDKITHAKLSMLNPYIYYGMGEEWDQLVLYEKDKEKLSDYIDELYAQYGEIYKKLQNINGMSEDEMPMFDFLGSKIHHFTDEGINQIDSLEQFKDAFSGLGKFPTLEVQNYISQLYKTFQSIARLSDLQESDALNTNQIVEIAKVLSYDGVVFKNIRDGGLSPSDVFVTFDREQVEIIDVITAAQLKAEEASRKAKEFKDTRRNLYESIKSMNNEQLDSYIGNSAVNFMSGIIPDNLSEVLDTLDYDDTLENIKNGIKQYLNEIVREYDKATSTIDSVRGNQTPQNNAKTAEAEISGMDKVATSTEEAIQAKKEFATANDGVQDSVDGSKSKLELEAELMEKLATAAREASDAKKEFTEANKLVQNSDTSKQSETSSGKKSKIPDSWIKNINVAEKQAYEDIGLTLKEYLNNQYQIFSAQEDQKVDEFKGKLLDLKNILEQVNRLVPINPLDSNQSSKLDELKESANGLVKELKQIDDLADNVSVDRLSGKVADTLNKNSAMPKNIKLAFEALQNSLNTTKLSKQALKELEDQYVRLIAQMKASGKTGISFADKLGRKFKDVGAYFATYVSIYDFINAVRQGYQYVLEIDKQMIELEKVSDMTGQRLEESFNHAKAVAKDLGSTISDVVSATADWARTGYDADAAEQLAEVAIIYKNVGDGIDIDTANESLISTLQGFQLEADEAMRIVDVYNEVANTQAISSAGLGEALKRSAASFNAANTSLEKSVALVTATNEVIQDPESVGTLWKTMSARIRGASTELAELSEETDEYTESTSKLRGLVKGLTGFDIMLDENTFKDIYDIILGIGKEWDNLTDVEQASLGEALAGKRNANALYAVLGNLETLEEAYKSAENAAGSALKEQEKWEQGLEARTNKLKASLEELSTVFLESDFLGGLIDFGTGAIEVFSKLIDTLGVIPTVLSAGGVFAGIKLLKNDGKPNCWFQEYAVNNKCLTGIPVFSYYRL